MGFWDTGMEQVLVRHKEALQTLLTLPIQWDARRFWTFLEQDFPFVEALYRYQVGLLQEAPLPHRLPLTHALMATVEELDWLLSQGVDPKAPVHPVRQAYVALLEEMGRLPYPYRLVFLYFLNHFFLEAWKAHVPLEEEAPWAELAQHWFAPEFQAVIYDLRVLAENQMPGLDAQPLNTYLARILEMEIQTWSLLL